MRKVFLLALLVCAVAGCGRFASRSASSQADRIVCIGQALNEMIYALGAQDRLVGVDYSSTYPPEIRNVQTVGYHRALSAEGILSLKPTLVIDDGNIGPDQVVRQLDQLKVPRKTFRSNQSGVEGAKDLLRQLGAFFRKEARAEELCGQLDRELAAARQDAQKYTDHPRVVVIHFGRASNVYLAVGKGGKGDGASAARIVEWAGGEMAIQSSGMQRMTSPEIIAKSNPDVILMTDYGYDRLGTIEQAKTLPGVAETNAARTGRIYRVTEHELMYFGPDTGKNVRKLAALLHQTAP